jgi:hypothetical protein
MIHISPKLSFDAICPKDGANLSAVNVIIPGIRCLADAVCPDCENRYYVDLPVGQALWSPVTLSQSTAEIYEPLGIEWFSQPLKDGFLHPDQTEIVPIVHKFNNSERIIIVNCLDFLYGHSLLKLLNVQRYLDDNPDLGCCVLVPSQLVHLVPEGVAEIWEFPVSLKESKNWYPSLAKWMTQQIASRKECFLSKGYSHPSHKVYDLRRFARDLPDIATEVGGNSPVILFSYREDRCWGASLIDQQRNLQKLYNKLAVIFPEMVFVLVGFGKQNNIVPSGAKIVDLRIDKFSVEMDRRWMAYMNTADCAIGVHGSNMLLPSGLAKSTVELVYTSRLGNTVQDFLFSYERQDPRDALLHYRMLYGNNTLSDVYPSIVCDSITNLLSFAKLNSAWFKVGEGLQSFSFDVNHKIYSQAQKYMTDQPQKPLLNRAVRKLAQLVIAAID